MSKMDGVGAGRLGRHEVARVNKVVQALGRLPSSDSPPALRLFRHIMGSHLKMQILLEASLAYAEQVHSRVLDALYK